MRTVRVERLLDLIGRFPRATVQALDERQRRAGRAEPLANTPGVETATVSALGESRQGFLEHPDCCVVFQNLTVPRGGRLRLGFAVAEGAWDKPGDGVGFRLSVAPHDRDGERVELLERYIDPKSRAQDRRWFDDELDLMPWIGRSIDVFFETDAGPEGNTDYDWAFWSAPLLVDADGDVCFDFVAGFEQARLYRLMAPRTVHLHEVSMGEDLRPVIFQHPTSLVRYTGLNVLPGARLRFGMGMDPTVWDREGDGVEFKVWVECGGKRTRIYERYIDPKNRPSERRWFDEEIGLTEYAGREISLELVTGPGPDGDDRYDWALWSYPRIESAGREIRLAEDDDLNFLLITVDTLRADHLGCYGNPRVRTPNMDALAKRGTLFRQARCQSNITIPSHLAILSGRFPHHHILDNRRHRIEPDVRTIAEAFQEGGYRTFAATSVHILGPDWTEGLDRGFDEFDSLQQSRRMGDRTAAAFHAWLEAHHQEPFFAWLHLFDPHAPYLPTRPFHRMYYAGDERDPAGPGLATVACPPFMARNMAWLDGITDPAFAPAQYAAQVSHVDAVVGTVLDSLRGFGLEKRTLVVLTADHGESLGEHGVHFDHFGLHEEVARVPLLVTPPALAWSGTTPAGRTVDTDVMSVDIAPTLLELAGMEVPDGLDGRSLVPLLEGGEGALHPYIVAEHTNLAQILLVRDGWKYLRTARTMEYTPSFSLREGEEMLFDLRDDPAELRNRVGDGGRRLDAFRREAQTLLQAATRPGKEDGALEMDGIMTRRLQDLGYL